jgi:hypothetical protein
MVTLAGASLTVLLALAVGFGGGWLARKETVSSTTTTTMSVTPTSKPTVTSTIVPLSACTGTDLVGTLASSSGAAGTVQATFDVTDIAGTGCTLDGYPQLQLLDANDVPIASTTIDAGTSFTPAQANLAPKRLRIGAGDEATFVLQFTDVPAGTQGTCLEASSLNVYPPGSSTASIVTYGFAPCDAGTVHVSPFFVTT